MGKVLSKKSGKDAARLLVEVPDDIFYHLCDHYLAYRDILRLGQCSKTLNARVTKYLQFKVTNDRLEKWTLFQEKRKSNDANLNVILNPTSVSTSYMMREQEKGLSGVCFMEENCEAGLFSSTEILLQKIDPLSCKSFENGCICLLLQVLSVIEKCDIWRKSVEYGSGQAVCQREWDSTLGRETVVVKDTKILRLYCHFSMLRVSEKKEQELYSASIYLKLDKHFNWPQNISSTWSVIDVLDNSGRHPWKNSSNTVHSVEVDQNWWKKIRRGHENFSLDNTRVVREFNGWVRVDLFYQNPIQILGNEIILHLETGDHQSLYWKSGIRFDFWQINKHK